MGIKAKIGLLILLVAGVIAVVVWDKSTTPSPHRTARVPRNLVTPVSARDEVPTVKRTPPADTREPITPVQPPSRPPEEGPPPSKPSEEELPPSRPVPDPVETDVVEAVFGPTKPSTPNVIEEATTDIEIPTRLPAPEKEPAPTAKTETTEQTDWPKTYVVKPGDNLWNIATQLYGSGKKWRLIQEANKDKLAEGDNLKVNMILVIPRDTEGPTGTTPEPRPTIPPEFQGQDTHIIEPGDNLYRIAEKVYGDASLWRHILAANKERIPDENTLTVGNVLVIPKVEKPAVPRKTTAEKEPTFVGKRTYKVESGDNLSSISEKVYGSPTKWKYIYEANKEWLKNEHTLKIGQVLLIPDLPEKETSKPSPGENKAPTSEGDSPPRRRGTSRLVTD